MNLSVIFRESLSFLSLWRFFVTGQVFVVSYKATFWRRMIIVIPKHLYMIMYDRTVLVI